LRLWHVRLGRSYEYSRLDVRHRLLLSIGIHPIISSVQSKLVVTTNNFFNQSVGSQPAFYVLENGSLYSTTQLKLPSNVEISLTVIDFDDGVGPVASQYAAVAGAANNQISIVNNTNVNSSEGSKGISITGGSTVSQLNSSNIAHTFTILATGNKIVLNVPLTPSSVISATFSLTSGNYTWQCEVPCGYGPSGWQGAMETPGWMMGLVETSTSFSPPAIQTFYLNIMEIMDGSYNTTSGAQPIYYLVENGTLFSSANIYLPVHTKSRSRSPLMTWGMHL